MISCLTKLAITLTVAIFTVLPAAANDILLNGDFSDGKTHWHGNGNAPDEGGKLIITLNPDHWTGVYQTFSAESPALQSKVTYSISDDCSLGAAAPSGGLAPPLTSAELLEATGLQNNIFNITVEYPHTWVVALVNNGMLVNESFSEIDPKRNNPHTLTTTITPWIGQFVGVDLCLVFPPGHGTVTLSKVELLPPNGSQR